MNTNKYRLNQYIAKAGITSRRKAEGLIRKGKFFVNENLVVIGQKVYPYNDIILIDGKKIKAKIDLLDSKHDRSLVKVVLREGRDRQVIRVEEKIGCQ